MNAAHNYISPTHRSANSSSALRKPRILPASLTRGTLAAVLLGIFSAGCESQISVTGWRNLAWGDTRDETNAKVQAEGLITCRPGQDETIKGRRVHLDVCQSATEADILGGASVELFYLDGRLGRVALWYKGMIANEAHTLNLEKAIEKKYCALSQSINEAVQQARLGSAGQAITIKPRCKTKVHGEFFVVVRNALGASTVGVALSDSAWMQLLEKDEFADAF